jgi:hypothetical protein
MTQSKRTKPERVAAIVDVLKAHGMRDEDVTEIQTRIDPLLEEETHIHVEGDNTHIHVDVHNEE